MGRNVRFIVLNTDPAFGSELRALLAGMEGAKIIAEVDEPALLGQAAKQFPVDVLLVNLDPTPDAILRIVGEIAIALPRLAIFTVSDSTDGQLILKAMRVGVREFLPRPIDASNFCEACDKVVSQRCETQELGKLITVTGASGGVGATVIAANLAVELAGLAEGEVTLVDLDHRFGQVATFLDLDPKYSLADLASSPEQLEPLVVGRALIKHDTGVRVLSRPLTLSQADNLTAASCVGVLSSLLQMNDYVVTDGPIRFDPHAKSVLDLSDVNLFIVQLLVPSVRNALRIIDGLRDDGYNLERTRLICNRVGGDSGQLSVQDVGETLNLRPFASVPDEWVDVAGAINLGEPLIRHSPKSRARLAIQKIAERLHAPECDADDKDVRKKGLIGRIFATS